MGELGDKLAAAVRDTIAAIDEMTDPGEEEVKFRNRLQLSLEYYERETTQQVRD